MSRTPGGFHRLGIGKKYSLIIPRTVQNLHDRYAVLIDTIKDRIITVRAAANAEAFITRDKRKGPGHFTEHQAGGPQFRNE